MKLGINVIFPEYDTDKDGKLNKSEFKNLFLKLDPNSEDNIENMVLFL